MRDTQSVEMKYENITMAHASHSFQTLFITFLKLRP